MGAVRQLMRPCNARSPCKGKARTDWRGPFRLSRSVEAVAAGAGTGRVGVVDREALLLDRVDEVDDSAGQVGAAHAVHDDLDAAEVDELVALERPLVEEQLVAQARATARLHGHAKG